MSNESLHHTRNLVVLIIILGVIIGIITVFASKYSKDSIFSNQSPQTIEEKKANILEQSAQAGSKPLSAEEKAKISKELGEGSATQYNLSDAEKDAVIKALNKN